ncbi:MAG: ABC transporter ATP-binding protein [Clostridia bacterium]|nr:ABC transporter ATP-binding protein [Clostridia bacterium]
MSLVCCKNLTLSYESGIAVENLCFELEAGDYLCVVGENGSGKSTLIKGMLGLMTPRKGEIIYNGVTQKEIGYLPQQTLIQRDFPASVFEVVLSGCLGKHSGIKPFYSATDKAQALENMERMGISDLKKRSYRELSGGQQQRVLLSRALCATTKLLLLDEPVTGLDPLATAELYSLIKDLNAREHITIVMVSHDVSCALHDSNKVLHMGTGGVVFFGSSDEYRSSDVSARFLRCDCACHERGEHAHV